MKIILNMQLLNIYYHKTLQEKNGEAFTGNLLLVNERK